MSGTYSTTRNEYMESYPQKIFTRSISNTLPFRATLGIDRSIDILHHIRGLPSPEERAAAVTKVQAVERRAMLDQQPQPGLARLMEYLQSRSLRRALCTRNFEYVFASPFHLPQVSSVARLNQRPEPLCNISSRITSPVMSSSPSSPATRPICFPSLTRRGFCILRGSGG